MRRVMQNRIGYWPIIVLCMLFACALEGVNQEKRIVLAVINSMESETLAEDYNSIHLGIEMILNYYGLNVIYHDLSSGIPNKELTENALAIVTYFKDTGLPYADEFYEWGIEQLKSGIKWLGFGYLSATKNLTTGKKVSEKLIQTFFRELGLDYQGGWINNPLLIQIDYKDPSMMDFETSVEDHLGIYEKIVSIDENNSVYLSISLSGEDDSHSDVVLTTSKGGFVLANYGLYHIEYDRPQAWIINPFLFFSKALDLIDKPYFDTTTLFGNRIFYSHIDGDGLLNVSHIDTSRYSSELIYEHVFLQYDLPFTASFIAYELMNFSQGLHGIEHIACKFIALDNLELGSHSFSHPLDWDKQLTAFLVEDYSYKIENTEELNILSESSYAVAAHIRETREKYLRKETIGSIYDLNTLFSENINKTVSVYQWTGNCRPPAEAIAMIDAIKMPNLNGGDSRFDSSFPSYTGVKPLFRYVKGRRQLYASNANENIYTFNWTGPFYAFRNVIQTFQQTEYPTLIKKALPRRVHPINLYYHYYSGEREASLDAVIDVYEYAMKQPIIPIFTSDFVCINKDFLQAEYKILDKETYHFSNYGRCRCVRFDKKIFPDFSHSKGVLGFYHWEDYTYFHLDNQKEAILKLGDTPPSEPYLERSSVVLDTLSIEDDFVQFTGKGFGDALIILCNLKPSQEYEVIVELKEQSYRRKLRTDSTGRAEVIFYGKGAWRGQLKAISSLNTSKKSS